MNGCSECETEARVSHSERQTAFRGGGFRFVSLQEAERKVQRQETRFKRRKSTNEKQEYDINMKQY